MYVDEFCTIDQLGTLARGSSRHRPRNAPFLFGGPYPFIQTADVSSSCLYVTTYSQTYTEAGLAQSKLWEPGVLCIVNAGVNTGDSAILTFRACFPDSIIGFRATKGKSNVRYVKYLLDSVKDSIRSITMGATQDNLSVSKLQSIKVPRRSVEIQNKIAAILSAYDDLIENNNRRIAILESMADQLYREWFVRFRFPGYEKASLVKGIPVGWSVKHLPEIATITYGFPFDGSRFNSLGLGKPIIRIRNIQESATSDYTEQVADDKFIVSLGDLLIGMDGQFHINHWYGPEAYLVQRSCRIKSKIKKFDGYLAKAIVAPVKFLESIIQGATVGHLGAKDLNAIKILVPSDDIDLKPFNDLIAQKIRLSAANNTLRGIRDRLSMRLIAGKIDLGKHDIKYPESMAKEVTSA